MSDLPSKSYSAISFLVFTALGTLITVLVWQNLYSAPEHEPKIIHVTSRTYDKVLKSARETNDLVICDFYADWCGPCIRMEPHLEKLAKNMDLVLIKVDIDECRDIMKREGVKKVPTLLIYSVKRQNTIEMVGFRTYRSLKNYLEKL